MPHPEHNISPQLVNALCSPQAVVNSIENDGQVYLWFSHLIELPQIKVKLAGSPMVVRLRALLGRIKFFQMIVLACLLSLTFLNCRMKVEMLLGMAGLLIGCYMILVLLRKKITARIARILLETDFPEDTIKTKTLFQLGEHYARHYPIPSLLTAINRWDHIARANLIITFLVFTFIFPLQPLWTYLAVFLTTYFCVNLVARTPVIFFRFK